MRKIRWVCLWGHTSLQHSRRGKLQVFLVQGIKIIDSYGWKLEHKLPRKPQTGFNSVLHHSALGVNQVLVARFFSGTSLCTSFFRNFRRFYTLIACFVIISVILAFPVYFHSSGKIGGKFLRRSEKCAQKPNFIRLFQKSYLTQAKSENFNILCFAKCRKWEVLEIQAQEMLIKQAEWFLKSAFTKSRTKELFSGGSYYLYNF